MTKAEAREAAGKARALEPPSASAGIVRMLLQLGQYKNAGNILIYSAAGFEADLSGLVLLSGGKRFSYPVCDGQGNMVAAAPGGAWVKNRHNIAEPALARSLIIPADVIDLALVPGVAFTKEGGRLGYGAGYYDRFLPLCKHAVRVGVAFESQMMEFETQPHDVAMHLVVTESRIYPCLNTTAQSDKID